MLLYQHLFATPLGRLFALLVCAVVGAAQRLPVRLVPEQRLVSTMRLDVVDHLSIRLADTLGGARQTDGHRILLVADTRIAQAVGAKGMFDEVGGASLLPLVSIATCGAAGLIGAPGAERHRGDARRGRGDAGLEVVQLSHLLSWTAHGH